MEAIGNRVVADLDVACPAGDPIGEVLAGSGVYCRIERSLVLSAVQPKSLGRFCCSVDGHRRCPTLRREVERIEAGETVALVDQIHPEVLARQKREEELQEQRERAAFQGKREGIPQGGYVFLVCGECGEMGRIHVPVLAQVTDAMAERMFEQRGWLIRPEARCPRHRGGR